MPRAHRHSVSGGPYHVTTRGNRREPIFLTDGDRLLFLDLVRQVTFRRRWVIYAYCLMNNHYHLVLNTVDPDLSEGMQTINGEYAQWFNHTHGCVGHVFQGRFHSVLVESDWHFLELSRYLALNPVRAGLCAAPADWRWGSYRHAINGQRSPLVAERKLLSFFGTDLRRARSALHRFVEEPLDRLDRSGTATDGPDPDVSRLATA